MNRAVRKWSRRDMAVINLWLEQDGLKPVLPRLVKFWFDQR
jgi:hypothetical protein